MIVIISVPEQKNSLEKSRLKRKYYFKSTIINGRIKQAKNNRCPNAPSRKISGTRDKPNRIHATRSIFKTHSSLKFNINLGIS